VILTARKRGFHPQALRRSVSGSKPELGGLPAQLAVEKVSGKQNSL